VALGLPYVIENVVGAPYRSGVLLCGSMFGMKVRRHRNFETSFLVMRPQCDHKSQGRPYTITGHGGGCESKHSLKPAPRDFWRYLDMPWATPHGVTQAIPPAYTEWLGERLMAEVRAIVPGD
jgi:DNA (cytosine-5)-methyltransferase 1